MSEVMEKESTELVAVPSKETALQTFTADKGLDPYLKTIRQELDKFLSGAQARGYEDQTEYLLALVYADRDTSQKGN